MNKKNKNLTPEQWGAIGGAMVTGAKKRRPAAHYKRLADAKKKKAKERRAQKQKAAR